jgi:MraZ protein
MLKEELLPAPLKKQLTLSLQSGFVLKRSVSALFGTSMEEWNVMMAKLIVKSVCKEE